MTETPQSPPLAAAPPVAYKLPDAARAVAVSEAHLRREIHAGRLPARLVGRSYRVGHDALVAWFDRLPEADYLDSRLRRG